MVWRDPGFPRLIRRRLDDRTERGGGWVKLDALPPADEAPPREEDAPPWDDDDQSRDVADEDAAAADGKGFVKRYAPIRLLLFSGVTVCVSMRMVKQCTAIYWTGDGSTLLKT